MAVVYGLDSCLPNSPSKDYAVINQALVIFVYFFLAQYSIYST